MTTPARAFVVLCGPELCRLGRSEMKILWQHSDDGVRSAIQRHRLPQNVLAPRKALLPGCITQDDGTGCGWLVLSGRKVTPEYGSNAQGAKEPGAYTASQRLLGSCRSREHEAFGVI